MASIVSARGLASRRMARIVSGLLVASMDTLRSFIPDSSIRASSVARRFVSSGIASLPRVDRSVLLPGFDGSRGQQVRGAWSTGAGRVQARVAGV